MKVTLGLSNANPTPQGAPNLSGLAESLSYFRQRVGEISQDKFANIAQVQRASRQASAPMAQVRFNPNTGKYIVGDQEFDANDLGAMKMIAEAKDIPLQPVQPGEQGVSVDEVAQRFQRIYDNAEVDNSLESIGRGMVEGIAGIPRGIASVFGADVANPLEGSADAWRRNGGISLREQAGRMHRPTESLVGLGQAGIQAIETGVPVLAAGAAGTALGGPGGGIAAGAAVAGSMAAESQGDDAQARLTQQFAQMSPEDLMANPEYAALRRAGNSHLDSVGELVRRGRTSAARGGFAIGGISGAIAPAASRFAGRALGLGGGAAGRADDVLGDAMLRIMRGGSTGMTATARGAGLSALAGGMVEGGQEFFETDISQGLADISAGQSQRYQMGQYGTADDFVGGFVGGAPFGAVGGLRNPGPRPTQPGTSDPSLNAAAAGVVAPPAPARPQSADPSGALGGNRQMVPAGAAPAGPSGGALRPLGTNWTGGPQPGMGPQDDIVDAEFREIPPGLPAPGMRALPAPAWAQSGPPRLEDGIAEQQRAIEQLAADREGLAGLVARYQQQGLPVPEGVEQAIQSLEQTIAAVQQQGTLPLGRMEGQAPTAPPAAYDPNVVLDNAPGRPSADVMAQALQQRGVAPEPEAAPMVDDQTPQMFGPAGGVTQAARRNDTLRESQKDIGAQIAAMLDPKAEKDSVWVPFGTRMPDVTLPDNVQVVPTPVGTLLTTEAPKAKALRRNPKQAENPDFISQLLGYTAGKSEVAAAGAPPVALEATTPDGAVADSELTTPEAAPAAAQRMQRRVGKTAKVATTTPEAALAGRTARVEAEVAPKGEPTPARPPNPDQEPGEVYVQIAPGGSPEVRRKAIIEELARLERKLRTTVGKSARATVENMAKMLQKQLDAIEAPSTQTAGRGPAKGSVQEGSRAEAGPERVGDTASRAPEEEAEEVLSREEANARAAQDLAEALAAEQNDAEPLDLDIAPTAVAPTPVAEGIDAPVLAAAEMTVEVEDGEAQVRPGAILDWYRKRIENLTRLLTCVLK